MPMTCQSTLNHPFPPVNQAFLRRKSKRLVILNFYFQFEVALTSKIFEFPVEKLFFWYISTEESARGMPFPLESSLCTNAKSAQK